MTIEIGILIGVIGAVLGLGTFYLGRRSEAKERGKSEGIVLTEIGYIKSGVDDIKSEQRLQRDEVTKMKVDIAKVEASTKQAHKRISELEGRDKFREE